MHDHDPIEAYPLIGMNAGEQARERLRKDTDRALARVERPRCPHKVVHGHYRFRCVLRPGHEGRCIA